MVDEAPAAGAAAPGPRAPLAAGTRVGGHYVIESLIGEGAMGQVYRAVDTILHRRVAIKILGALPGRQLEADKRARREGRALSRIQHPNVVAIHEFGRHEGANYLVMQLVRGKPLDELLRSREPLTLPERLHLLRQIASALTEAHRHGVVHRDIKPQNILVTQVGQDDLFVMVVDFGLARLLAAPKNEQSITRANLVVGTPRYMAPEQILQGPIDGRCDIYSLGVLAYELLVRQPPFAAKDLGALLQAHLHEPAPPPSTIPTSLVRGRADEVLLRALAKDPDERYQQAEHFIRDLEQALSLESSRPRQKGDSSSGGGEAEHTCPACSATGFASAAPTRAVWRLGAVVCGEIVVRHDPEPGEDGRRLFRSELAEVIEVVVERVAQRLRLHGGNLTRFGRDRFVGVVGLDAGSELACENALDAVLSIRAALAALETDPTLGTPVKLDVRLAADHGTLLVARRADPMVVDGGAVSKAEALLRAAEWGQILVTSRMLAPVRGLYYATAQPETHTAYSILERRPFPAPSFSVPYHEDVPFIGRQGELSQVEGALDLAIELGGVVVASVVGPAGIGKSRLASEFIQSLDAADRSNVRLGFGRCTPHDAGAPYEPVTELLRGALASSMSPSTEGLAELLLELGIASEPYAALREARVIAGVLGLEPDAARPDGAEEPRAPDAVGVEGREAVFARVADIFAGFARQSPLVFLVEDHQWARPPTVALLRHLVGALLTEPVLIVLLTRELASGDATRGLGCPPERHRLIQLTPLSGRQTDTLAQALMQEWGPLSLDMLSAIREVSGRVPLHVIEMAEAARAEPEDDGWTPGSFEEVVLRRLEALPLNLRRLVERHAVAGPTAWQSLLADGLDVPRSAWTRLQALGFIVRQRVSRLESETQTAFRHELVREIVYESLRGGFRSVEHARIAGWLEGCPAASRGDSDELILHHYAAAATTNPSVELATRAGRFALRSGRHALQAMAADEAQRLFAYAVRVCRRSPSANAKLVTVLREGYLALALIALHTDTADEALAWLDRAGTDSVAMSRDGLEVFQARLATRRAEVFENQGRFDAVLRHLAEAERGLPEGPGRTVAEAAIAARSAMALVRSGRTRQAREAAEAALAAIESRPPPLKPAEVVEWHRAQGTLNSALGHAHSARGNTGAAEDYYRRSHAHWEKAGYANAEGVVLLHLGNVAFRRRDRAQARALWTQAAEKYSEAGSLRGVALCSTNLGELALLEGKLDDALSDLLPAERTIRALQAGDVLPELLRILAETYAAAGNRPQALSYARDAHEAATRAGLESVAGAANEILERLGSGS